MSKLNDHVKISPSSWILKAMFSLSCKAVTTLLPRIHESPSLLYLYFYGAEVDGEERFFFSTKCRHLFLIGLYDQIQVDGY